MQYLISAANLRAAVYGIAGNQNFSEIKEILSGLVIPEFQCKSGVKIGMVL